MKLKRRKFYQSHWSLRRIRVLRPKSTGISNTLYCPEHVEVVVEVVGIAMAIFMSSAIGMAIVPGMEEMAGISGLWTSTIAILEFWNLWILEATLD